MTVWAFADMSFYKCRDRAPCRPQYDWKPAGTTFGLRNPHIMKPPRFNCVCDVRTIAGDEVDQEMQRMRLGFQI